MFQPLVAELFIAPWTDIGVDADFAHRRHRQPSGELQFHYRQARQNAGDLRVVHITAPKIQIFNAFFFPSPRYALPIYAVEFVLLGKKPVAAVIDCVDVHGENVLGRQWLYAAHRQYPALQNADDPPAWYLDCRSGGDFFLRPDHHQLLQMIEIHRQLWQQLQTALIAPPHCPCPAAHQQALQRYQCHHRDHSPGLPLLQRSFGESWTTQFLTDYLFKLSALF